MWPASDIERQSGSPKANFNRYLGNQDAPKLLLKAETVQPEEDEKDTVSSASGGIVG